eukprot:TRINITY_DN51429_c0_g2_i2.p1 TRINITY_DN51429_c0_g2~~TRINITY_DN51429_c0_g2_i2.p1  ORF type:complete len:537 (-),score=87.32 TRINITY_DN51429_c0_g2_i2:320-1930(-)
MCSNPRRFASCNERAWWTKRCCLWTYFCSASNTWKDTPVEVHAFDNSTRRLQASTLFINTFSIRQMLHENSTEEGRKKCKSLSKSPSSFCRCVFNSLFTTIVQDLREVAKVHLTPDDEEEARDELMTAIFEIDGTKFQKDINDLHGISEPPKTQPKVREWLQSGRWAQADSETDGDMDPKSERERDMSAAEKKACQIIKEEINAGILRVIEPRNHTHSWVGDGCLDAYLAVEGARAGLSPRTLDRLRRELFSTQRMGCDRVGWAERREAAERREQHVGGLMMEKANDFMEVFDKVMQKARLPRIDGEGEDAFATAVKSAVKKAAQHKKDQHPYRLYNGHDSNERWKKKDTWSSGYWNSGWRAGDWNTPNSWQHNGHTTCDWQKDDGWHNSERKSKELEASVGHSSHGVWDDWDWSSFDNPGGKADKAKGERGGIKGGKEDNIAKLTPGSKKVFVGGLPELGYDGLSKMDWDDLNNKLQAHMAQVGACTFAEVGRHGTGVACFTNKEDAIEAVSRLDASWLDGKHCLVVKKWGRAAP